MVSFDDDFGPRSLYIVTDQSIALVPHSGHFGVIRTKKSLKDSSVIIISPVLYPSHPTPTHREHSNAFHYGDAPFHIHVREFLCKLLILRVCERRQDGDLSLLQHLLGFLDDGGEFAITLITHFHTSFYILSKYRGVFYSCSLIFLFREFHKES